MILHAIINEYDIFTVWENNVSNKYQKFNGGIIEYAIINEQKQLVRLHSTDPYNYLKQEFNPYSIIK